MLTADLLQRFSRECQLLRQALAEDGRLPEMDYRILRSNINLLLAQIEQKRELQSQTG